MKKADSLQDNEESAESEAQRQKVANLLDYLKKEKLLSPPYTHSLQLVQLFAADLTMEDLSQGYLFEKQVEEGHFCAAFDQSFNLIELQMPSIRDDIGKQDKQTLILHVPSMKTHQ